MRASLKFFIWMPAAVALFGICGCGIVIPMTRSENKLSRLSLGESREKVIDQIGDPATVRGARTLDNGKALQVDEYELYPKGQPFVQAAWGIPMATLTWWLPLPRDRREYWIQYVDGKLERWGRAGDWQPDININSDVTIHQKPIN